MKKKTSPELLVKALKKLVILYGMNEVRHALDVCELVIPKKRKAGHPPQYDEQRLHDIWLYVEEGIAHSRQSVTTFCNNKKNRFQWISSGKDRFQVEKTISGKTLQRRYHEAKAFIEKEAALHKALASGSLGIKLSGFSSDGLSPRQIYLNRELKSRISRKIAR